MLAKRSERARHGAFSAQLGLAWVGVAVVLAACAGRTTPSTQAQAPPQAAALPLDVRWVRSSAEFRGLALQVYRQASERLAQLAAGSAAGSWAVILDADETVLDNSEYQRRLAVTGAQYSDSTWAIWVREKGAPPVPGAPDFTERVRALGGRVVIVTNRADTLCAETRENLRSARIVADLVLCKPAGESNKNPRFLRVQAGTAAANVPALRVVAWVGDNIQDFPNLGQSARDNPSQLADFGVRYFLLPNPMYGSWTSNP